MKRPSRMLLNARMCTRCTQYRDETRHQHFVRLPPGAFQWREIGFKNITQLVCLAEDDAHIWANATQLSEGCLCENPQTDHAAPLVGKKSNYRFPSNATDWQWHLSMSIKAAEARRSIRSIRSPNAPSVSFSSFPDERGRFKEPIRPEHGLLFSA